MRTFTIHTRSEAESRLHVLRTFLPHVRGKAATQAAAEIAELEALIATLPDSAPATERGLTVADESHARWEKIQRADINAERRARRTGGRSM